MPSRCAVLSQIDAIAACGAVVACVTAADWCCHLVLLRISTVGRAVLSPIGSVADRNRLSVAACSTVAACGVADQCCRGVRYCRGTKSICRGSVLKKIDCGWIDCGRINGWMDGRLVRWQQRRQKQQSGAGWNRAHRLVPVHLFCWLLTWRATGEQTRSCSPAESGYVRRNKVEASARCVPGLSFSLAFNTGSNSGAQRALPSAFVAPLSFCPNRLGRKGAPGVNLDRLFGWLLTRGATWVHGGRCCRAESRYARRNRSEASARCGPRSSFLLAFNTGRDTGAALGQVEEKRIERRMPRRFWLALTGRLGTEGVSPAVWKRERQV